MLLTCHTSSGKSRCAFSTGNDSYIPKCLVSLLSFTKHNPDFDMFVLCSHLSEHNKELCNACGVTPIKIDLSEFFYQEWRYPKECYYHFKAPEIFLERGYAYSVYIDGDTYCNRPFPWLVPDPFHIAGTSYDTVGEFFIEIKDFDRIKDHLILSNEWCFDRKRIQSGVLLYNNRALQEFDYFGKARFLYDYSIKQGVPRMGDDSLLALTIAGYPQLLTTVLPRQCNTIDFKLATVSDAESHMISDCIVYHFVQQKPWFQSEDFPTYAHKFLAQKWLEVMINSFPDEHIQRCFPEHYKSEIVESNDVKFYWFTGQCNFGDWITPYLVERICGRSIRAPVDPTKSTSPVVLSTGSIMRLCSKNTVVWGSGIRDRYQDISPGRLIRSVRGPITRNRILEIGGECPPIFGDPALLLPRFYDPRPLKKRHRLAIIPHISQFETVRDMYAAEPYVAVLDLRTRDIENIVDEIVASDAIVSSSLHGIIVSNAYNIPVRWIKFDGNIFGDDTKYYDHFASINRPEETFIDALVYQKLPVEHLVEECQAYELVIDLDRLWEASVFHKGEVSKYIRYVLSDKALVP